MNTTFRRFHSNSQIRKNEDTSFRSIGKMRDDNYYHALTTYKDATSLHSLCLSFHNPCNNKKQI